MVFSVDLLKQFLEDMDAYTNVSTENQYGYKQFSNSACGKSSTSSLVVLIILIFFLTVILTL